MNTQTHPFVHGVVLEHGMLVSVQGQLNGVSKALPPCWDKPWVARLTQKTPFPAGTSRGPSLSISQHSFPNARVEGQSLDVVALGAPTFYSVSQRPSNTCVSSYYPRRQSSKLPWIKPGLILFVCLFVFAETKGSVDCNRPVLGSSRKS